MAKGEIANLVDEAGYGLINTDETDENVFFHMEDIDGLDLEEGIEIEFDIADASKGPRATNLRKIDKSSTSTEHCSDTSTEEIQFDITEFLRTHAPDIDNDVEITISRAELSGQFERLRGELDLDESEVERIRDLIHEIIEYRIENEQVAMDTDMKEATAQVIASTLVQEYVQTGEIP